MRYGLIPYIKDVTFGLYVTVVESVYSAVRTDSLYKAGYVRSWKVFTARYGLIPYIKQVTFGLYVTVVESVYSAVRADSLYKSDYVSSLKG